MVGAMGRGAGKTKFACSLISKFSSRYNIIGIKVTAIEEADSGCPRGGQGCGSCSSLNGYYDITEETDSQDDKDTARMLAAGAGRVFWLKALKAHLEEGITALIDIIGNDVAVSSCVVRDACCGKGKAQYAIRNTIIVCESNSLRSVVEPGLFVMIKDNGGQNCKPSAEDVIRYADRVVSFDGNEFDIDLSGVSIVSGKWAMRAAATAIIMAGGRSRRMGQDKSMLPIRDKPMIKHIIDQLRSHFNQIIISSNDVSKYSFPDVEVVPDRLAGRGPLMGIACALRASADDLNFVMACDIPEVDISLMKRLLREAGDVDAVVPRTGQGRCEPLFAVYKKSALAAVEAALLSGNNRIIDALSGCRVKYIDLSETGARQLKNLNTMDDYQDFIRRKNDISV